MDGGVTDNRSYSTWRSVTSGLLLGHVLLDMSISDLGEVVPEGTLVEFAEDTKSGGPRETFEGKGWRDQRTQKAPRTSYQTDEHLRPVPGGIRIGRVLSATTTKHTLLLLPRSTD